MKTLLIVESPSKIKTIQPIVGDDYLLAASVGHIRDLGVHNDGLDNNLNPVYQDTKPDVISKLRKLRKQCDKVVLMTDLDREGEAIAWHLKEVLNLRDEDYLRCATNDLTEPGIKAALASPRKINMDFVRSQEARRVLDRIIGFKVSRYTQALLKLPAAGRVQSTDS
ncbi:toprim domain-containing protein [Vibrio mediterranei]|uniref:toprim domain-containing protein n=1 Tax=Vibrio mediterranei TaxID=689 RepID=UPI0038CE9DD0